MKKAYVSPPTANVTLTVVRDSNPRVVLTFDVGLPNWLPHFELKMPLTEVNGPKMAALCREALGVLLDEVIAFMMTMGYDREIQVQLYSAALACFDEITPSSEADARQPEYTRDDVVQVYEGTFPMPASFIDQTQARIVTAAPNVKRSPAPPVPMTRVIQMTKMPPNKITPTEAERTIRMYKNRSLTSQPKPMYIVVYDMAGKPTGVLPLNPANPAWKSQLLRRSSQEEAGKLLEPALKDGKVYRAGRPVKVKKNDLGTTKVVDEETGVGLD
jgi:hypothetical protein